MSQIGHFATFSGSNWRPASCHSERDDKCLDSGEVNQQRGRVPAVLHAETLADRVCVDKVLSDERAFASTAARPAAL